jgi:hypothetical protein
MEQHVKTSSMINTLWIKLIENDAHGDKTKEGTINDHTQLAVVLTVRLSMDHSFSGNGRFRGHAALLTGRASQPVLGCNLGRICGERECTLIWCMTTSFTDFRLMYWQHKLQNTVQDMHLNN